MAVWLAPASTTGFLFVSIIVCLFIDYKLRTLLLRAVQRGRLYCWKGECSITANGNKNGLRLRRTAAMVPDCLTDTYRVATRPGSGVTCTADACVKVTVRNNHATVRI
jgi:hypothetical protein